MFPFVLPSLFDAFVDTEDFRELPAPEEGAAPPADGGTGIDVCTRPAFGLGPLGDMLGIDHWWLDTPTSEAGLGSNDATSNPLDTTMVDHSGAAADPNAICAPVEQVFPEHANVDPNCVEEAMTPGLLDFGDYGLEGICKDAIDSILAMCDPDPQDQQMRDL